jgi:hypothetical protein
VKSGSLFLRLALLFAGRRAAEPLSTCNPLRVTLSATVPASATAGISDAAGIRRPCLPRRRRLPVKACMPAQSCRHQPATPAGRHSQPSRHPPPPQGAGITRLSTEQASRLAGIPVGQAQDGEQAFRTADFRALPASRTCIRLGVQGVPADKRDLSKNFCLTL